MYSLILPTYRNPKHLKLCIDSILENSYYKTHQFCIHINGYDQESIDYLKDKKINYTLSNDNIGISKAVNACIKTAVFDKVIFVNDDQYFSKNWDYNLHRWEIELKSKFPEYTYIIGYRMCEPTFGSFPPICNAGKTVDSFNINIFNDYIEKHSSHSSREEWLSCSLYPKDIVLNYISNDFESKLCDIDFVMSTIKHFKDNNIKFLIFGVNDCFVYHFGSIVTKRLIKENIIEPNEISKFEDKWKINVDTAYNKILRSECKRSVKLVDEMLKENMTTKHPTISTYISTTNALFWQSTLEQTIQQATLFSDEIIVVNSISSSDGTQNLLNKLKDEYPNIIKLYTFKEDYTKKWETVTEKKTFALKHCTSDYCILQDDDECIHEKYVDQIKQLPLQYPDVIAFRFNTIHFYRSYDRYQNTHGWYQKKIYMIKNIATIKHGAVGTDLDNHVLFDNKTNKYMPLDNIDKTKIIDTKITSYHYGWVRNDAILLMKKYVQDETWHGKEYWKNREFPYKFDNLNELPEFKDTHPKYMIPIIEQEKKFNTKQIKEFEKDDEKPKKDSINLQNHYNFSDTDGNPEGNVTTDKDLNQNINNIKISACILTRNEPTWIKGTILHVYPYVNKIVINDGSDTTSTIEEVKKIVDIENKIKIFHNPGQTSNFAEERNNMQHNRATGDYVLHIDSDERFDVEFLKNMRNLVWHHLDKKEIPIRFRFSRRNDELNITKDPDYQIRFLNRLYSKWERNVHEIPIVIDNKDYYFHKEKMKALNLVSTNYVIDHLTKDRTNIRKRWDVISDDTSYTTNSINRRLLICSMFKDSSLWMNDVLSCIDNLISYNKNVSNDDKLLIKLAFLKGKSNDNTIDLLDKYIKNQSNTEPSKIWYEEYNVNDNNLSRYKKLALLRNYLIENSTKNIKLNDDDLILFMDSDIKFDKNIVHELIVDMNECGADIIAPLICIEENGVFKNNYFYDTLAFRNVHNELFSHFKPYIFGKIKKSTVKRIQSQKIKEAITKIDELNELRKINWEFNLNTPLNNTYPENLYREAYSLIDLNIPIEVHSVGSFYLMKYKAAKNIKYSGSNDSEQVEFMNNARSKGYKIFVSQRLKVLHVNLEKYGLKWH